MNDAMIDPAFWLVFGRTTLVLAFGLSALAKLAQVAAFVATVRDFGLLPRYLTAPVAAILLAMESAVAVLLLLGAAMQVAAIAALILLGAFSIALVHTLSQGRRVACRCFGGLSAEPATWIAVVRNVLLAIAAAVTFAAARSAPSGLIPAVYIMPGGLLALSFLATLIILNEAASLLARPGESGAASDGHLVDAEHVHAVGPGDKGGSQ